MGKLFIYILFSLYISTLSLDCDDFDTAPNSKSDCHNRVLSGQYSNSNSYCCYIKGLIYGSPDSLTTCFPFYRDDIDNNKYKDAINYFKDNYNCKKVEDFDCHTIYIKYAFSLLFIFFLFL